MAKWKYDTVTTPRQSAVIRKIVRAAKGRLAKTWAGILAANAPLLAARGPEGFLSLVTESLALLRTRPRGRRLIRITPRRAMILQDDRPFLMRTLRELCRRHGVKVSLILHPVVSVRRSAASTLESLSESGEGARESFILLEAADDLPKAFGRELAASMRDIELAVRDFEAMMDRWDRTLDDIAHWGKHGPHAERGEAADFIRWAGAERFVFLGFVERSIERRGRAAEWRAERASQLGILAGPGAARFLKGLSPAMTGDEPPLSLFKTRATATLYEDGALDAIAVRRLDARGRIVGEKIFLGHYSDRTDLEPKTDAPILREKFARIRESLHIAEGSFDDHGIHRLFSGYRVDTLLLTRAADLARELELALRGVAPGEVEVSVRYDPARRGIAILLVMPQDRYRPSMRDRVAEVALPLADASALESRVIADSAEGGLVRLQFLIPTERADVTNELAPLILAALRSWDQRFEDALRLRQGARALELHRAYADAFDESYKVIVEPELAAADIADLEALVGETIVRWGRPSRVQGVSYLKISSPGRKLAVSDLAPILVSHGFVIDEENAFLVRKPGLDVHLHIFRLRAPSGRAIVDDAHGRAVAASILAAFAGRSDFDSLCALIVDPGMTVPEIELLRLMRNYARQIGAIPARKSVNRTLLAHPHAARLLIELFRAKFDPGAPSPRAWKSVLAAFHAALAKISSLDDDRALRAFFNIIDAAVRTNFFLAAGDPGRAIALKIECARVARMPSPRPWREIVVYGGARMEGCHLRGGPVARGGIRWSERPEDFRTEILGLMKTQVTKNAQIVPTGAKGGFIMKRPPADKARIGDEILACYTMLIRAMLDMQDTIDRASGRVVHPDRVLARDDDDPYLVVAADKGTAKFSDTANALSAEYGFWLGDAFASGGSNGYDHKKEGITARGAWISVERHFRDGGRDIRREPFTAVGIGDMSGDVFGNGLLLSRKIRLVAAFDHRDIFLDPDPDPEKSFRERQRLFSLPRSSWADYARAAISKGGGVFPRSSKSIPLSPEICARLRISSTALDPDALIRAILAAPVDLLYNGGIGTYVKASHEPNSEVGDPQNDAIRVDAKSLRCAIVGEGGNLGFTQGARIEFALAGGKIFTDAMDNSAGVDLSDHEVNLKILLDGAKRPLSTRQGAATQRTQHLKAFKLPIIDDVLQDNLHQTLAVSLDGLRARRRLAPFAAAMADLARRGVLDPKLEGLPDEDVLRERSAASQGLTAPELCVLLSYAKIDLTARLLDSPLIHRAEMNRYAALYFAPAIRRRFEREIPSHRLRDHILATVLTNLIVNFHGATAIHRLTTELGLAASRVVESLLLAHEILEFDPLIESLARIDGRVSTAACYEELVFADEAAVITARWLVRNVRDLRSRMARGLPEFSRLADRFLPLLERILPDAEKKAREAAVQSRILAGMTRESAERASLLEFVPTILDIVQLASARRRPLEATGRHLYGIGDSLRLEYLIRRLKSLPPRSDWDGSAATDVIAELRQSRRRIAARIMDLKTNFAAYTKQRYRSWETLQSAIARIESEEPVSIAPFIVISSQIRNLASL